MARSPQTKITAQVLREVLTYFPESGDFFWRERDATWFSSEFRGGSEGNCARWNATWAGKKAGFIDNSDGYHKIAILGNRIASHRLAWLYMTGEWPINIDHINGDRADNRWINLRNVSKVENNKNKRRSVNNSSGTTGVSWNSAMKKWHSQISHLGKRKHLGFFEDLEEAVNARKEAEVFYKYHKNHGRG